MNTDNFDDELGYYMMLDSKFVANSEKEYRENKWPFATHYISLTNEGEEMKYEKNKRKYMTLAKLADSKFLISQKKDFCYILELANTLTELTEELTDNLIFKFIDSDNSEQGTNIAKFNELYDLLSTDVGRAELAARLLLKKSMDTRVVYEKQDSYIWNRSKGVITLGDSYSEAVQFLLNPKKEGFVAELESEIKAKIR